jgi:hypothetical protein
MDLFHMAEPQGSPSSNPRHYAYVHERVLCNAECAANVVVDDDHCGLFSCIMDYLDVLCMTFMYCGYFEFMVCNCNV